MCMGGSREYLYFQDTPKDPEAHFDMGHLLLLLPTCTLPKRKKRKEKGIDLHRTQRDFSLRFSASGPVKERQLKPLPHPKPPPTTKTLLVLVKGGGKRRRPTTRLTDPRYHYAPPPDNIPSLRAAQKEERSDSSAYNCNRGADAKVLSAQ
jgi:hypothetical protein